MGAYHSFEKMKPQLFFFLNKPSLVSYTDIFLFNPFNPSILHKGLNFYCYLYTEIIVLKSFYVI